MGALLTKGVRLQLAILECSYSVLFVLIGTIQRGEVKVRRCEGDAGVVARCSEDVVYDDSG